MHWQRLVRAVFQQAVVGVGQQTVGGELQRLALRQDLRQARMASHREAASEHFMGQPHGRLRAQALAVQAQQNHRTAAKRLAQANHQPLQADRRRQLADQVGELGILDRGEIYHFGYP
ncbi:hypothetical protein D9M68_581760 [compost metagenome]